MNTNQSKQDASDLAMRVVRGVFSTAFICMLFASAMAAADADAANAAPQAVAKAVQAAGKLTVNFDGAGSTDTDGKIVSYAWNFGNGKTGTGAKPVHTYAAAGTYQVTLTVRDDGGASASSATAVTVVA